MKRYIPFSDTPTRPHAPRDLTFASADCRSAPLSASVAPPGRADRIIRKQRHREGAVNGSDGAAAARHGGGGHHHDHGGHADRLGGGRSNDRLDESLPISKGTPRGCISTVTWMSASHESARRARCCPSASSGRTGSANPRRSSAYVSARRLTSTSRADREAATLRCGSTHDNRDLTQHQKRMAAQKLRPSRWCRTCQMSCSITSARRDAPTTSHCGRAPSRAFSRQRSARNERGGRAGFFSLGEWAVVVLKRWCAS